MRDFMSICENGANQSFHALESEWINAGFRQRCAEYSFSRKTL